MNGNAQIIAEETHSSPLWGTVILLPVIGLYSAATSIPMPALRVVFAASGLILLGVSALAWSGFRYIFTPSGVEIRTLGFHLRSIRPEDIREYAPGDWNIARGYGIRGLGGRRAYVWGNKGVRIKTTQGEVFLGHRDPQKIIHDLDLVKQFAR